MKKFIILICKCLQGKGYLVLINLIKMCNNMQVNVSKWYYIAKVSTSYKLL